MSDGLDLRGKAVVVTGGGRGLGAAVAMAVAQAGGKVVVNDLDQEPADESVAAIRAAGGEAVAHVCDITDWSQAEALIARCVTQYGKIDGLVNNAGVHFTVRTWDMEEDRVRKQIEVNVMGTLGCTRYAAAAMRAQGFGSIVNTTSGAATGLGWRPDYGASKGAVSSFAYTAAIELKEFGVRVNCMAPNANTRMLDELEDFMKGQDLPGWTRPKLPPPEANTPIHLYLLSDRSKHITGQVLGFRQDGGLYIGAHPAMLEPMPVRGDWDWTPELIAQAVETGQVAAPQLLGRVFVSQASQRPA